MLKDWRERHGLTQRDASVRLGVPFRTLQQWEQGRQEPRGFALATLSDVLLK